MTTNCKLPIIFHSFILSILINQLQFDTFYTITIVKPLYKRWVQRTQGYFVCPFTGNRCVPCLLRAECSKWGAGINCKSYWLWYTIDNCLFRKFSDFLLEKECVNSLSELMIISIQVLLETISNQVALDYRSMIQNIGGFNDFIATGINTSVHKNCYVYLAC